MPPVQRAVFISTRAFRRSRDSPELSMEDAAVLHVLVETLRGTSRPMDLAMAKTLIEQGFVDIDRLAPQIWTQWLLHQQVDPDLVSIRGSAST